MLEDFQVNGTAGVPTVYLGLMDYMSASSGRKLNHLKLAICGGAACPQKIFDIVVLHAQLKRKSFTRKLVLTCTCCPAHTCIALMHPAEATCTQAELIKE